jgi:opacity protein-like surface antigen
MPIAARDPRADIALTEGGARGNVYVSALGGSGTTTKGDWTLGGGVEYSWDGPWSAKLEYLYVDWATAIAGPRSAALRLT